MTVIIVGGGIIGAMTALRLARDHAVTLIDPDEVSGRTTDGSLAWLNVCTTGDVAYARLRKAALDIWHDLLRDHPDMPVTFTGSLIWGDTAADTAKRAAMLQGIGWQSEVLDSGGFTRRAPGFANAPEQALFAPQEGRADPRAIVSWAMTQAQALGVLWLKACVASIGVQGNRLTGVMLDDGSNLAADAVVITAGHGSAELLAPLGVDLPVLRKPGFVLRTAPLPPIGTLVFGSEVLDYWQGADGRVLMASSLAKTGQDALDLAASDALAALQRMYPALKPEAEEIIQRDRPIPSDGVSLVGGLGLQGLYTAVTHSGVTLAPVMAETLAQEIAAAEPLPVAAPFSPARFEERNAS